MSRRLLVLALVGLPLALPGAASAEPTPVTSTTVSTPVTSTSVPSLSGTAAYRSLVRASPGTWDVADVEVSYEWLRGRRVIAGATRPRYRPRLHDVGTRLRVRVTASAKGYADGVATSTPVRVRRASLVRTGSPRVTGTRRYQRTLTARAGSWEQRVDRVSFQWLRDGRAVRGATSRRYRLRHSDVGHRVRVQVTARKQGFRPDRWRSARPPVTGHLVPLRRTVLYRVETRGRIAASLPDFRRLAHASLNDPRGWRSAGVAFREVRSGGGMSLVLSEASRVPGFHPVCSSRWSCRVGRYVVINQDRWRSASPAWRAYGGSLRGYRHMVVNHETGHWLGHGHRSCPARGAPAPVMQQQSISLDGCRFNPFPKAGERFTPRFR